MRSAAKYLMAFAAYGKLVTMFHGPFPVRRGGFDTSLISRRPLLRAALSAILLPALCLPARRVRAGLNLLLNEFTATRDELQAEDETRQQQQAENPATRNGHATPRCRPTAHACKSSTQGAGTW